MHLTNLIVVFFASFSLVNARPRYRDEIPNGQNCCKDGENICVFEKNMSFVFKDKILVSVLSIKFIIYSYNTYCTQILLIGGGIGHIAPLGDGARNDFGILFEAQGKTWTNALCTADSDGDGVPNGMELGDPACVWTKGDTPLRTVLVSHPGEIICVYVVLNVVLEFDLNLTICG